MSDIHSSVSFDFYQRTDATGTKTFQNSSGDEVEIDTDAWPLKIINDTDTPIEISFITDFVLSDISNYFIVGSRFITLNGTGRTFTINTSQWNGLIQNGDETGSSVTQSSFGDITVKNFIIGPMTTNSFNGNLCWAYFGNFSNNITVENCTNYLPVSIYGGGIFGFESFNGSRDITVKNCTNYGNINQGGGIFGFESFTEAGNNTITDCVNNGTISGIQCGGIFGYQPFLEAYGNNTITDCVNNGTISGSQCGGIFGPYSFVTINGSDSTNIINNCTNNGSIEGSQCGGICGLLGEELVYGETSLLIQNCVNEGDITNSECGGLVYKIDNISIRFLNCYSNGGIVPGSNSIISIPSSSTVIDNCYIINGDFTSSITPINSYNAQGYWESSVATTNLTLDAWVFAKDESGTNMSLPFLLKSLNPDNDPVLEKIPSVILSAVSTDVRVGDNIILTTTSNSNGTIVYGSYDLITIGEVTNLNEYTTTATATVTGAGSTEIKAMQSATNEYYSAFSNTVSFTSLNNTTLTFTSHPTSIFVGDISKTTVSTNSTASIQYDSTFPEFASIDDNGIVTGKAPGQTTIRVSQDATDTYASGEDTFELTVVEFIYDYNENTAIVTGITSPAQNVTIPSTIRVNDSDYTVVGIDKDAFTTNRVSGTIVFPNTLTFIGSSAFQDCALTGTLNLPDSIETIGASAFRGCGFSGMLVLPPNLTILEEYVFAECSFTSMAPPTQLTSIGARAFYNLPLFVYDFTQCEQLEYIDPSAFDEYSQSFLDINVYVTQFTYDRLRLAEFPTYVKFHTGVPVSNICFIAGTGVQTDQGTFPIESLTRKHTLRGQSITLTKTKHDDPYLVKIQAYAFTDTPTQDTYMSMNHRVYFNHDRVKARDLVNGNTVTLVDYHGEPLYNVLVKAHTSMLVHGMRVETLDPTSAIALVYTSRLPPLQRVKIIQKLNTQENYEETVMYLKRIQ